MAKEVIKPVAKVIEKAPDMTENAGVPEEQPVIEKGSVVENEKKEVSYPVNVFGIRPEIVAFEDSHLTRNGYAGVDEDHQR